MPVPFILDTDTAQDDCVAIIAGILDPEADLRALTMVAGNVSFDQQVRNAQLTLNALGRLGEVPIHLGCRQPMVLPWVSAENVHSDGSGGLDMDFAGTTTEDEHAVDALIRMTAEAPGEISVVAIGPLTNIAMAAVKDPAFVRNVRHLVIMGGSNNGRGNITPAAEFNLYVDPHAAKVVFEAGFDITVVPWAPLTLNDAVFSREQLAGIESLGTTLSQFFLQVCGPTLAFDESVGIPGTTHPDSLSVAVLLHPDLVLDAAEYHVAVEADSELTRGYSSMSWGVHGLAPNARVIEHIDAVAFHRYLTGLLATPTEPTVPLRFGAPFTARQG
ncbi:MULTISPECIES: nucleoside hydrolase [unclassified Nocardioides]|uniref:nucleoside hydrolase n=1 Tax=unclassified Nocardioides TaxID=2615069 RepID=UPI00005713FB|nr:MULTISPECIES: nucleoside hydrolase [unclassified Nocardioides]ABL80084.1 Inosine/uridine-preferring nucleoside hydrolase [Nocardioides sp. JS614]